MKKIICLLMALSLFPPAISAQQRDTVRILGFGNSWTRDSMRWLSAIARSAGRPVIVGHAYLGGSSLLEQFYGIDDENYEYNHGGKWMQKVHSTYQYWKYCCSDNPRKTPASGDYANGRSGIGVTLESVVGDEPWDIIVFQPSQCAFSADNFRVHVGQSDELFNMNALVDKVKTLMQPGAAEKVRIGLMIPFTYAKGSTRHSPCMAEELRGGQLSDSQEEWDRIFEEYHECIQKKIAEFVGFMGDNCDFTVNVGLAIQMARQDSLLSKTGYLLQRSVGNTHLSEGMAMYVASLCYAYKILGIARDDVTFYPAESRDPILTGDTGKTDYVKVKNTPQMAARAREIAFKAVGAPESVSRYHFKNDSK